MIVLTYSKGTVKASCACGAQTSKARNDQFHSKKNREWLSRHKGHQTPTGRVSTVDEDMRRLADRILRSTSADRKE